MRHLTRAQFIRRGAAAAGGLALLDPASAFARSAGSPSPIPGGFDAGFNPVPSNPLIHVLPPGAGFEMSTITDFKGIVGGSDTEGTAHGSDGTQYSFDTDMRFMTGTYVDTGGRVRTGTFGFIWIDLFTGAVGVSQVHDFNPGIGDNGLFWTIPIGNGMVDADPTTGAARLRGESVKLDDYHDIGNAIFGGGPAPIPSRVSYDVQWTGHGDTLHLHDTTYGFEGDYVTGPVTISFTAFNKHGDVIYASDPTGQSNGLPPAVGTERNGVFFS